MRTSASGFGRSRGSGRPAAGSSGACAGCRAGRATGDQLAVAVSLRRHGARDLAEIGVDDLGLDDGGEVGGHVGSESQCQIITVVLRSRGKHGKVTSASAYGMKQ